MFLKFEELTNERQEKMIFFTMIKLLESLGWVGSDPCRSADRIIAEARREGTNKESLGYFHYKTVLRDVHEAKYIDDVDRQEGTVFLSEIDDVILLK